RMLASAVAGIVLLLINLFLWSWLLGATHGLRSELAKRKLTRNEQIVYLREADLWHKRAEWLRAHQPVYKGASDAPALLVQLMQIASKYNVLIENPAIGSGEATPTFQSVFASIDTKSPWTAL